MSYRPLDHTADLALEIEAASGEELFAEALRALTDCLTDLACVAPREEHRFALTAPALDLLLVDWLSELLAAYEIEGLLFCAAAVRLGGAPGRVELAATARGEPLDPDRHPLRVLVKGITYHALALEGTGGAWRARVVLDL